MTKIQNTIKTLWGVLVWLFEQADIIPALVIISAWHYYGAMAAKGDPAPVAIALGVLTDIGHYRSIKGVARKPDELKRWAVGLVLTVLTGYYHYLWYQDIILALCVPALIISLALLSKWDGWDTQAIRMAPKRSADKSEPSADVSVTLPYVSISARSSFQLQAQRPIIRDGNIRKYQSIEPRCRLARIMSIFAALRKYKGYEFLYLIDTRRYRCTIWKDAKHIKTMVDKDIQRLQQRVMEWAKRQSP